MDKKVKNECFELLCSRFGGEKYWKTGKYSTVSFQASFHEVMELREKILASTQIPPEFLLKQIQESCLLDDWEWFKVEFLLVSEPQKMIDDSQWIFDTEKSKYFLCVGKQVLWLLSISRCLGLIEFEKLRQLRYLKIKVIGASVSAMTIDLLVSLGCENITCIDPGLIELSNLPRLPNYDISTVGKSKVDVLMGQLKHRNPYGIFVGFHGKIIENEKDRSHPNDQLLNDFLDETDLIIEVIDDVRLKILVQDFAIKKKIPLLFIADVGNEPLVKFIDHWNTEQANLYRFILKKENSKNKKIAAACIYSMVKENVPSEHVAQFLLNCFGVVPFWSQTPNASRLSSGMAVVKILDSLKITGKSLLPIQNNQNIYQFCQQFLSIN